MTDIVFLFGGQSSRDEKMVDRLSIVNPEIGQRVRQQIGSLDFSTNVGIQTSVIATTLGWLECLNNAGVFSTQSAGLSLGEYAHLVDIGCLQIDDCTALVKRRGELYDAGPNGCMAAIYPCDWEELNPILADAGAGVSPAVFNSPTQTVIGGERAAVTKVMNAADDALFTMSIVIEERIPMHTVTFKPVAEPFSEALDAVTFSTGKKPYWANVSGEPNTSESAYVKDALTRHVFEPVRWCQTINRMVEMYHDAIFIEVGPRTVLRDLMLRRWHPEASVFAVDSDYNDPKRAFNALLEEVGNVS